MKNCFYSNSSNLLFPYISIYKYDYSQLEEYKDELEMRNGVTIDGSYISSDGTILFSSRESFLVDEVNQPLSIIFDKNNEKDLHKTNFYTINNISVQYIHYFTNYWITLNYIQYLKNHVALIRNTIFRYLQSADDSIYLNKTIALKRSLLKDWMLLKRFSSDMRQFRNDSSSSKTLSEMSTVEGSRYKNRYDTLQEQINQLPANLIDDVTKSFQELIDIFQQTGNDNVIESNMIIQKRVTWSSVLIDA